LQAAGVFKNTRDGVRLLAKGALKTKVDITVAGASKAAAAAVEKAGGSLTLLVAADKERAAAAATKGPEA
jgi:large subunit ribosomal protein L15